MNSKKSIRKSHKSHKKNNKNKLKSRKSVKKISRKQKKHQKGGECQYLKVEGMKLTDLTIPDQYGLLFDNC
jgi:hypothetical protein